MRRSWLAACKRRVKALRSRKPRIAGDTGVTRAPLLLLGLLLARPGTGGVGKRGACPVVDRRARGLEHGALDRGGGDHLRPRRLTVRRLRRFLVVDDAPQLLEQLLRDEA